jgi:hypothetical protein
MFAQASAAVSLKEKIKLLTYQTLYNNVLNRLCTLEVNLDYDFFTSHHSDHAGYLQQYFAQPTLYHCKGTGGFQGLFNAGNSYLVVARFGQVIIMLEPGAAHARNLPFIAVLENGFFKPLVGCAVTFWQNFMEPCQIPSGGNTLNSNALSYS